MQIYVLNLGLLKWTRWNNLNPLAILLSIVRHEQATNLIQVTCLDPISSFCEMFKYKTNGDKYFMWTFDHKLLGSQFDNSNHTKFIFHKFILFKSMCHVFKTSMKHV